MPPCNTPQAPPRMTLPGWTQETWIICFNLSPWRNGENARRIHGRNVCNCFISYIYIMNIYPIRSMGLVIYLDLPDFYGKCRCIYIYTVHWCYRYEFNVFKKRKRMLPMLISSRYSNLNKWSVSRVRQRFGSWVVSARASQRLVPEWAFKTAQASNN